MQFPIQSVVSLHETDLAAAGNLRLLAHDGHAIEVVPESSIWHYVFQPGHLPLWISLAILMLVIGILGGRLLVSRRRRVTLHER